MFRIKVFSNISGAHHLREYKGKCEKLHGHNWKVEVFFEGKELNSEGMLLDFKDAKKIVKKITKKLDHENINEVPPFDKLNPTAENIARFIFGEVQKELKDYFGIQTGKVIVWETDTNCAEYYED